MRDAEAKRCRLLARERRVGVSLSLSFAHTHTHTHTHTRARALSLSANDKTENWAGREREERERERERGERETTGYKPIDQPKAGALVIVKPVDLNPTWVPRSSETPTPFGPP